MEFTTVDNYSIRYQRINVNTNSNKPIILFLHEALGSITQWKNFPLELCQACDLEGLIYERRGHGYSSPFDPNNERTSKYLEQYALTELPLFLKSLQEKRKIILFGHSDGGSIALLFSSKFPSIVKAQIVLAAHVFVEEITLEGIHPMKQLFETTSFKEKLSKHHKENTIPVFYAWYNTWLSAHYRNWNIEKQTKNNTTPSLIIQGTNDKYGSEAQVDSIMKSLGNNPKKLMLPNCGHSPHLEAKEETISNTVHFIESL